jgi:hypothetical protein
MNRLALLVAVLLVALAAPVSAQTLIGLGPFTATWDYDPASNNTFKLYVDSTVVATTAKGVHTTPFLLPSVGPHIIGISALDSSTNLESTKTTVPVNSTNPTPPNPPLPPVITDNECAAPLGAHAVAVFPSTRVITTGRPGSKTLQNFQVGGPDPIVEIAIRIDGVEQTPTARGNDLSTTGSLYFTQPAVGSHLIEVRALNLHGCQVVRSAGTLVVKP